MLLQQRSVLLLYLLKVNSNVMIHIPAHSLADICAISHIMAHSMSYKSRFEFVSDCATPLCSSF